MYYEPGSANEFGEPTTMMDPSFSSWSQLRRLDEQEDDNDDINDETGNSAIIKNTLRVYGSFYFVAIILFEFLRRKYPRLYSIRSWVPEQESELAKTKYPGLFSWFWKVYQVSDQDIFDNVGMDALCFLRAMRFCRQISIVGVANALWLLPTYRTAKDAPETAEVTDDLDRFTLANLPASSMRFFATVLAAYIMVFCTMYFLYKEFKWYTYWRHKFLSRRVARNYAVYVYGIPKEFRSSHKLATYFRDCSSESAVLEAHVAMDTPHLESLQSERENIVKRLEHIAGIEKRRSGKLSRARKGLMVMDKDDLVRSMEERLSVLNKEIPRRIHEVMAINDKFRSRLTRLQPAKNLLGDIVLSASPDEELDGFFLEPTIDENVTMEFEVEGSNSKANNMRGTFSRNGTSRTLLTCQGDSGSQARWGSKEDEIIHENADEDENSVEEPRKPLSKDLESDYEYPDDVFDSGDRAFLSIFLPDAEGLLPGMGLSRKTLPPTAESTAGNNVDDSLDQEEPSQDIMPIEEREVPSTVSLVEDSPVDLEAQRLRSEDFDPSESEGELPLRGNIGGQHIFREVSRGASHPGMGSRASSASTSSHSTMQALRAVADAGKLATESITKGTKNATKTLKKGSKFTKEKISSAGTAIASGYGTATTTVLKAAKEMKVDKLVQQAGNFVPVVINKGEGEPRAGGFVVFTNLYTAQTAVQMIHHSVPYQMEVQAAPQPGDIFWRNVGMKPSKRRLGRLYSVGASATLCFFWSIPTAFVASLTSVSTIKEEIPKLGEMVEKYPWTEELLFQLAPMILLFLNEVLLPEFLKVFATWEGHVSAAVLEASLFLKLSAFMIIQTFFVSAISGSIYSELTNMIKNPEEIISLLSTSLPSQSAYFMQIMFAATFLLQAIELLRIYPLGCALVRRCIGPNATAKERRSAWMYIFTLEDPPEFWHAETFAQIQILYVMVLLVYAVIAPFTACAILFCFILLEAGYRYQLIHNYPKAFDTGGELWHTFVQFVLASLVIAELTLAGLLALKQSRFAGPAVVPLMVITILFIMYINGRHSHVMKFLPTRDCVEIDKQNAENELTDFAFCKGEYLQPSLKKYREDPEYDDF